MVAASAVAAPDQGTTINTGLIEGGSATNVVAGRTTASVDIRVSSEAEQVRVDEELDAIRVSDPRVRIDIDHAWNRPPMTLNAASAPLLDLDREVAREQGRDHLPDAAVGGASDADFVSALGLPVLCGMGAVGNGAHAQGEFIPPTPCPPRPPWSRASCDDSQNHCGTEAVRPDRSGRPAYETVSIRPSAWAAVTLTPS